MVISETPGSGMIFYRLECMSKRDENQNTRRKEAVHYTDAWLGGPGRRHISPI